MTLAVSLSVAAALSLVGIPFWSCVILATVVQIVVWQGFQYYVSVQSSIKSRDTEKELLKEFIANSVTVPCAYCKHQNWTLIRLDDNNSVKCENCKKESVLYVHIETAQVTVPLKSLDVEDTIKINEL